MLEQNYGINVDLDKNNNCNYNVFQKSIMHLESSIFNSEIISTYKNMLSSVLSSLLEAMQIIIDITNKARIKRYNLPIFISHFIQDNYYKHSRYYESSDD